MCRKRFIGANGATLAPREAASSRSPAQDAIGRQFNYTSPSASIPQFLVGDGGAKLCTAGAACKARQARHARLDLDGDMRIKKLASVISGTQIQPAPLPLLRSFLA